MKKKRVFVLISLMCVSISFGTVKIYESVSSENHVVNIFKRATAEAGAVLIKIYDPYEKGRKKNYSGPYFDSKRDGTVKTRQSLLLLIEGNKYLKDSLKIAKYINNAFDKSSFEFDYQPYDEPKLKILREKYNLDDVVKGERSEFQQMLLLKDWVKKRWKIGVAQNISYNFDALNILERATRGEQFFCSEYATTFVQILAAYGFTGRYIGLLKGHVVMEAWSNEFDKWIVMDPDFNIHYERSGIPLNALELHYAWVNNNYRDIKIIKGNLPQPIDDTVDNYTFGLIDYYENFYVRMRNDWFSNKYPHWHPRANSIMNGIEWKDERTKNDIRIARETDRKEDIYWQLNHVYLSVINFDILNDAIKLNFYINTITPNFDNFLIKLDDKDIQYTTQPNFDWNLHKGLNTLEVASFNKANTKGVPAIISINYN